MIRHRLASFIAAVCGATVAALAANPSPVSAQGAYPNKPIRIIVPAGAGDSCDILSRLIAPKITERTGQAVVVDNRPGGAGQLGLVLVKQAAPDGYTLGCGQGGSMVIVPLAYAKVGYNSRTDFSPIAMMASNFLALVVSNDSPFKSVKDLIDYGRANPSKLTFGTNGEGAFLHFATEEFRLRAGFEYIHVPHRGMGDVFTQLIGGQISASMGSFIAVQPLAEAGKVRLLGIARAERSPDYPNVPTIAETLPGFASGGWFGIIGPAGLPAEVVALINREVNWALTQPDVRERMRKMGLDIHMEAPAFLTQAIDRDEKLWGKVIKDIGFKPR
jgi:tripartite-type tricarboxylate transporter receptor subunit TctC